ncbi:FAD-dependent oxidoreductase, partial [Helicobacter pylori]
MVKESDILVIGGGHAGIEASLIAAKMGARVHLITMLIDTIGLASCNPAIGGLGKGHLTKEVDVLGGAMGIITDNSGLQYRVLNASKGPAVRGTRAQIDMDTYRIFARNLVLNTPNLSVSQEMTESLIIENDEVVGVTTNINNTYKAKKVIITTGTFL